MYDLDFDVFNALLLNTRPLTHDLANRDDCNRSDANPSWNSSTVPHLLQLLEKTQASVRFLDDIDINDAKERIGLPGVYLIATSTGCKHQ